MQIPAKFDNSFGSRLRFVRERKEISRNKLANAIKIHPASIYAYETQNAIPSIEVLKRICDYLKISGDELLYSYQERLDKQHEKPKGN